MQISSINSHNNISHKGFKADYNALRRQYSKAQFFYSNTKNANNFELLRSAQDAFNDFCISNPLRTFLLKKKKEIGISSFKKSFKQHKTQEIFTLEKAFIQAREKMTVQMGDKQISMRDYDDIYFAETDPLKKEEMRLALINALEPFQKLLEEIIVKRNEFAQKKGYKNYYDLILKEKFDIDTNEAEEIIKNFSSKKDVISSVAERKVYLAKHWNIKVDELQPHHYDSLTALYNFNDYIESPEQIIELTKKTFENLGFDLKKLEKENRIFYDLLPQEGKSIFTSFCKYIPEADANGLYLNTKDDLASLRVLLHEFGHLVYNFNVSELLSIKNKYPKAVYTEAIAMMFEKFAYKENLLKDIIPKDKYETFKKFYQIEYNTLNTSICASAEFEKEIYKNPHQDYYMLKNKLNQKYNLNAGNADWLNNLFITHPARSIVYLKALTLADKIYDKLNGALGGELLNNPKTADFLTKAIFKYGRFMNDKRLNKKLNNLA